MSKIKIVVSGIGAVGGYYGGLLAAYYQKSEDVEVVFISRGENLKAIQEKGLLVKRTIQSLRAVPALVTDNPAEAGLADYLFLCTKSFDLEDNIQHLRPLIGPETVILPLLNGIDIAERVQSLLPGNRVWKGCVYIGARLSEPGLVEKFTLKDRFIFGNGNTDKEKQQELATLLSNARVLVSNPDDIDQEIWKKFFMISTGATITSYFNESIHEVINKHLDLFITLGYELKSVAEAKGVKLPDHIVDSSIKAQRMMPNGSTTSMHSDFKKGGKTEIETLTGQVIRMARELGVETPTYQFMYNGLTEFPYPQG